MYENFPSSCQVCGKRNISTQRVHVNTTLPPSNYVSHHLFLACDECYPKVMEMKQSEVKAISDNILLEHEKRIDRNKMSQIEMGKGK